MNTTFQITETDLEIVLRNNAARITNARGLSVAQMAETLIDAFETIARGIDDTIRRAA